MHPFQVLGNSSFMAVQKSGLYRFSASSGILHVLNSRGYLVGIAFSAITSINVNPVVIEFCCGNCSVMLWRNVANSHITIC